ncbi:MAG: UDP-N-acetylglucosamine 1-carboxyvinyltransferase, partial [Clostridia bacterium]|nr:UDP-N-acetylglucosamine 1-carboxyvinyltransferase [Clostridia bacterium]
MEDKFIITGGKRITGSVSVDGAKNAAVAILPATLIAEGVVTIDNLPYIDDVITLNKIIQNLGAKTELNKEGIIKIDPSGVTPRDVVDDIVSSMRASYYL